MKNAQLCPTWIWATTISPIFHFPLMLPTIYKLYIWPIIVWKTWNFLNMTGKINTPPFNIYQSVWTNIQKDHQTTNRLLTISWQNSLAAIFTIIDRIRRTRFGLWLQTKRHFTVKLPLFHPPLLFSGKRGNFGGQIKDSGMQISLD